MKRILQSLLLIAILAMALCVSTAAESPTQAGMYNINGSSVTLTPQTADQTGITAETQGSYTNYANAVRFGVNATGLTNGNQYLLLVLKGTNVTPTVDNIVYIDQAAANDSGTVTFNAYPSSLTKSDYSVYIVGADKAFVANSPAATFNYWQTYKLGDVDDNGKVTTGDAVEILQSVVGKKTLTETQRLAADIDANNIVTTGDAVYILQFIVGKDVPYNLSNN